MTIKHAQSVDTIPSPGQLVRVRSRQYLVENVVAPSDGDDSYLVTLSCLEDDAQGDALTVLWNKEVDAKILGSSSWEAVANKGFDDPELFSAYLHTLQWSCVTATKPQLFQAPYRAGIQVKTYQLEPLRKALAMPRVNLFIADDVGVGKTIEAGLILRELILRQKVRRVVISCPPSVVRQWRDEMESRFGLTFIVIDRDYVVRCRQERGYGTNPWNTHSRFIVSHALIRDETYASPLRAWLGDFFQGSLLILDEAHNAAPASGTRYATDSHLTEVVRDLAPRFEHRLFLSATPHNGHSNSFSALLEILDPQRFCRGVPVAPRLRDEVMVRRLKQDIRELGDSSDFPERRVIPVVIDGLPADAPELKLSRLLQTYRALREQGLAGAPKSRRSMAMLVIINLQKRLLSSIEAFARTLRVHRESLEKAYQKQLPSSHRSETDVERSQPHSLLFQAPDADDARADFEDAALAAEEEAEVAAATHASASTGGSPSSDGRSNRELALLDEMLELANKARYQRDSRLERLLHWMRTGSTRPGVVPDEAPMPMCPQLGLRGAKWSERRVIIFTEYADTKRYLLEQLERAIQDTDQADSRLGAFHGGMSEEARDAISTAFNAHPSEQPLRILVATDAAREGLNLQNHCADLFHFDVPWNPSRMEQRNGRIDRKLQKSPVVRCHYFLLSQRPEDKVLETLVRKTATVQEELGSLSPTIQRKLNELMLKGIPYDTAQALVASIEKVGKKGTDSDGGDSKGTSMIAEELETTRKRHKTLQKQLDELREMLSNAKKWLGFQENHFRQALSASLCLLNVQPLQQQSGSGNSTGDIDRDERLRWVLPDLELRFGDDPAWSHTLDSLRAPRKPGQKYWDWRRENPIRPVVFEDTGEVGGKEVHLHLEHRLAQRLLNRFLSQGFLYDELSRALVCATDDPEAYVLAFGRLSLYGRDAARLHDELVVVAAKWLDPESRGQKKLKAVSEHDVSRLRELLDRSLPSARKHSVSKGRTSILEKSAQRDVEELRPTLTKRGQELEQRARRALQDRGEAEAKAMVTILEEQKTRIEQRLRDVDASPGSEQLTFDFPESEKRQLEADKRYWPNRLAALKEELVREPDRIRAAYDVKAVRIEPAGLVYLWPISG